MKLFTLALLVGCLAATAFARYDGYELLRIHPRGQAQVDFVYEKESDEEFDFWFEGKDRVDILIPPQKVQGFKDQLRARDIFFTVENADIQKDIDAETERLAKKVGERGQFAIDYDEFNTYEAIMTELDELVARCPPSVSCETFVVGRSYEGREIKGIRIFSGNNRPAIWLDATIHAREWLSTATHLKIVKHLIDDYTDNQVSNLLSTYDFYLIPVSNPDGYVHTWTPDGRLWRKNRSPNSGSTCLGTDLNRNYNQMWGNAGASTSPCSETYRGSSAASEVETQAVQNYLRQVGGRLILSIHFHTYGNLWLIPWGSVTSTGACNYADDHAQMMIVANAGADAVQNTYNSAVWKRGNSCETIYPASGITMDYSKGVAGVKYTVTPELRGNSFIVDKSQIHPSYVEIWNGFLATVRAIEQQERN